MNYVSIFSYTPIVSIVIVLFLPPSSRNIIRFSAADFDADKGKI